jgi:hypothetical protein
LFRFFRQPSLDARFRMVLSAMPCFSLNFRYVVFPFTYSIRIFRHSAVVSSRLSRFFFSCSAGFGACFFFGSVSACAVFASGFRFAAFFSSGACAASSVSFFALAAIKTRPLSADPGLIVQREGVLC